MAKGAATRERILATATAEFAANGIAGTRIDRIASEAGVSKGLIYAYFPSKDRLFDAVFDQIVAQVLRDAPIDPTDLPGYAGRLFDGYEQSPHIARLASWYRLERAGAEAPLASVVKSNRDKVAAITAAQKAGSISDRFAPADLLGLVVTIAAMWTAMTPEYAALTRAHSRARRRKVVTDAVAALLAT